MLPAVCICMCVFMCAYLQTPLAASVSLLEERVCACVWERDRERERDASAQAKRKAMPGKTGQYHASLCCIPKLQINVLVQFSSQANHSCLLCYNKTGLKTLATWISPNAGTWFALFFREDAQIIKLHCTRGGKYIFSALLLWMIEECTFLSTQLSVKQKEKKCTSTYKHYFQTGC